jgi:hypothetical protein
MILGKKNFRKNACARKFQKTSTKNGKRSKKSTLPTRTQLDEEGLKSIVNNQRKIAGEIKWATDHSYLARLFEISNKRNRNSILIKLRKKLNAGGIAVQLEKGKQIPKNL